MQLLKKQMIELADKAFGNLRIYVNAMNLKNLGKTIVLILILLFLNVGNKFPAMSESKLTSNEAELYNARLESDNIKAEYERYVKLYQEIYEESMIQQIEFESEVLIPDYFDFKYVEYAYKTSQNLEIAPRITFRLIFKESSFDNKVISTAGAKGLMQLMPSTRKTYYEKLRIDTLNLDKTQEDIYIGLNYLKDLNEFWKSRGNSEKNLLKLSLAAYNAGTLPVMKHKGVPPYKETQAFVMFILKPHSNPTFYANIIKKNEKKEIS